MNTQVKAQKPEIKNEYQTPNFDYRSPSFKI